MENIENFVKKLCELDETWYLTHLMKEFLRFRDGHVDEAALAPACRHGINITSKKLSPSYFCIMARPHPTLAPACRVAIGYCDCKEPGVVDSVKPIFRKSVSNLEEPSDVWSRLMHEIAVYEESEQERS